MSSEMAQGMKQEQMSADEGGQPRGQREETGLSARAKRLHHLDWLRGMFIAGAVFLHVNNVFGLPPQELKIDNVMCPEFPNTTAEYTLLNQDNPDWREGYSSRFIMHGRQCAIPLLFWISGYALGLGKEKATSSMFKIVAITMVGMLANGIVYLLGPRDDECSWFAANNDLKEYCDGKANLISYGIGTGAGWAFCILYQFWFTAFMVVFLAQLHPLFEGLRELAKSSAGDGDEDSKGRMVKYFAGYWVFSSVVYIGLCTFWNSTPADFPLYGSPTYSRTVWAVVISLLELPYMGALSRAVTAENPKTVRLWQYLAALLALLQFIVVPDLKMSTKLDGGLCTYYHFFKQFYSLGFVMSMTRKKTEPVVSGVWPIVALMLILFASPTTYFQAGQSTYPYFPFRLDRFLYSGMALLQAFIFDRVGHMTADAESLSPAPPGVNIGFLLAYLFHVPLMVVFEPLADTGGALVVTSCILATCTLVAYFATGRK